MIPQVDNWAMVRKRKYIIDRMSYEWCKFDSIDQHSYIIGNCVLVAQCLLFVMYCRSACVGSHLQAGVCQAQKAIQRAMLLWFIVAFTKSVINTVGYPVFMAPSNPRYWTQLILSAICLFCDRMSSFILHAILMRIPCIWIRNTICKLEDNENLNLKDRLRIDRAFSVVNRMAVYCKVRLVIVLIHLSFAVSMCFYNELGRYSRYLTVITMTECTLCICIYTFGIVTMFQFRKKLGLPQNIYLRLGVEYLLLLICCFARLIFNTLEYFVRVSAFQANPDCSDKNPDTHFSRYAYMSVGYCLMHVLPISSLLLIYWPEDPLSWQSNRNILREDCVSSNKSTTSYEYHSLH